MDVKEPRYAIAGRSGFLDCSTAWSGKISGAYRKFYIAYMWADLPVKLGLTQPTLKT